jgi:hypothetical protein
MRYATVEDVIASFPHPILPTVQGDPYYQTIHAIRRLLQANARSVDTHFGGGALGHLGLIVSDSSYAMIFPEAEEFPTLWESPTAPGWAPGNTDGTTAQISAARRNTSGMKRYKHIEITLLFNKPSKNRLSLF